LLPWQHRRHRHAQPGERKGKLPLGQRTLAVEIILLAPSTSSCSCIVHKSLDELTRARAQTAEQQASVAGVASGRSGASSSRPARLTQVTGPHVGIVVSLLAPCILLLSLITNTCL
jgi:hypothetical protein